MGCATLMDHSKNPFRNLCIEKDQHLDFHSFPPKVITSYIHVTITDQLMPVLLPIFLFGL